MPEPLTDKVYVQGSPAMEISIREIMLALVASYLLDVSEDHRDAKALSSGFTLEQSRSAFGDVAPLT